MGRGGFLRTTVRWYGYVIVFLVLVLLLKVMLGNPGALRSVDAFAEVALQPANLYVLGFFTLLYMIFVLFMWMQGRNHNKW